jgi:hypothetical protein
MTQRVDFSSPSSVMAALSTRDAEIERLRAALRKIAAVHPQSWTTRVASEALNEQLVHDEQ